MLDGIKVGVISNFTHLGEFLSIIDFCFNFSHSQLSYVPLFAYELSLLNELELNWKTKINVSATNQTFGKSQGSSCKSVSKIRK